MDAMTKTLIFALWIIAILALAVADRITKGRLRTKRVILPTFIVGLILGVIYAYLSF